MTNKVRFHVNRDGSASLILNDGDGTYNGPPVSLVVNRHTKDRERVHRNKDHIEIYAWWDYQYWYIPDGADVEVGGNCGGGGGVP